jgi:hypothetical protein
MSFASRVERLKREYGLVGPELATVVAADFLNGGGPRSAAAFDRIGRWLAGFERLAGEGFESFRKRAPAEVQGSPTAARVVLGGLLLQMRRQPS